ncbi:MAG: dephospho-CoA kinase [Gammaproteobacteria bacterium RBG_16_51_14]|nr:MAG: dephospho-CoA kinase [Gammaproteobacteria bacterium RBG_16_51_14]
MTKPLRVGLTGGIGSGKSTVAGMFTRLGVPVIDADSIAHDIVQSGQPALQAVVSALGPEVLDKKGNLDREYMRILIFHNPEIRHKLESILHPIVYTVIEREYNKISHDYCVIVVPLLVETGAIGKFDRILVIDVPEELQLQRAGMRDAKNTEQIRNIMQVQATRTDRIRVADDIISNSGNIAGLQEQVNRLHQHFLNIVSKRIVC